MFNQMILGRLFYIVLIVVPAVGCIVLGTYLIHRGTPTTTTTTQPSLTPLEELNKEFRNQYAQARTNFWQLATENGTVIIGSGSSLSLIHEGTRYPTRKAIPQVYHDLKSIAHIPLAIYILLINNLSGSTNVTLEQYWYHLNNLQVPPSIMAKEKDSANYIISESKDLLRKVMNNKDSVDRNELTHFCQKLANHFPVLLDAAAIAHLNTMHDIVQDWINEHNIDLQDPSLKVLLIGPRTARQNNLQSTYFERLLGVERKRNIAYIEEFFANETKAISIFSTWFFDEELSITFFNDLDRMHRDLLLSDNAYQRIEQLIPQ